MIDTARSDTANRSRPAGVAVAALLLAAPLLTWAGAAYTAAGVTRDIRAIRTAAAPRLAAASARDRSRAEFDALLRRPGAATSLDSLARALPRDAVLIRAARYDDGRLAAEVLAPDPDRLRAALRRSPAVAAMRDRGQRGGAGGMVVLLEEGR